MSEKLFNETNIPNNYVQEAASKFKYYWQPEWTEGVFKTLFSAAAEYLGLVKSTTNPVALVINDERGNTRLGFIVTYHKPEEESMPGNWTVEITTNSENIEEREGIKIISNNDSGFQRVVDSKSKENNFTFNSVLQTLNLMQLSVDTLLDWLDANCVESGEETKITLPGYFEASVALETGEKIKSITLDGALKTKVKGDAMIEVE